MMFRALFLVVVAGVSIGSLTSQLVEAAPTASAADVLLGCKDKPVDIYFLLDCSSSVWIVDFEKQLEFVVSLVNNSLDIHGNATRVGLGVFSDDFYHVLDIGRYPNKATLIRQIRGAPYLSGLTYTGKGLHGMRTHGFRAEVVRPNVTKVGILITDGRSRRRTNTLSEASLAREEHIWLFAIGVGKSVDDEELAAIASVPKNEFSFHVSSFDILSTLTENLAISTCSLQQPQSDASAKCGQKARADVMFVYNAATMSGKELEEVNDFVSHVVSQFNMASGNMRVGVTSEGTQGIDISLSQYIRRDDFLTALMNQPRSKLASFFKKIRLEVFGVLNWARRNDQKVIVAFVDDVMEDRNDLLYEAMLMKYDDVVIHVIAVGPRVDFGEMKQLATTPNHITEFQSYSDLRDAEKREDFLTKLCKPL